MFAAYPSPVDHGGAAVALGGPKEVTGHRIRF